MAKNNKSKSGGTGGESSLRTLVDQLRKESIDNGELIVASNFILSNISSNIADMTDHILKMPVIMSVSAAASTSNLSGLEGKAEVAKETEKDNKREDSIKSTLDKSLEELAGLRKDLKKGGLLDMILAGAALLAGSVIGLAKEYLNIFRKVFKPLLSLFSSEGKGWTTLVDKIKDGWKWFTGIFTKLGSFLSESKIGKFLTESFSKFVGFLDDIGKVLSEAYAGFSKVFGAGKSGGGFIKAIVEFFESIGSKLSYFFKLGKVLGSIIGKILIPIQVIMSIFDTVSGALDGWDKTEGGFIDKLIGAVKGGLTGLLNGLIGGLLDLLKDGASWVLSMLGFENASKSLDSFSFQDVIKNAVDGIVDFFMTPVRMIQELVKAFKGEISWGDMFKNMLAQMITGFLAPFSGLSKVTGIDIKQKVLDLLGLPDPKGGGAAAGGTVQATGETGVATKALEKTTTENVQAKDAAASTAAAASAAVSNSSSKQTVNNNTTQAAIIKTKTTNWEPDDQWSRGMAYGA